MSDRHPLLVRVGSQSTHVQTHAITVWDGGINLDLTPEQAQALARDLQLLVAISGEGAEARAEPDWITGAAFIDLIFPKFRKNEEEGRYPVLFDWQPINTAPKDGTWILARRPGGKDYAIVSYDADTQRWLYGWWLDEPKTVWTRLPPLPAPVGDPAPWGEMKTAPRDGTWFLAVCDLSNRPELVRWSIGDGWIDQEYEVVPAFSLLYWMPIVPPEEVAS